ncbi:MAG: rhodanese-like domain-containing protein [Bacteroidetes bacterium]|nr:rhodanese-like domain-containing protein [Bacteroidota bacterium]
MFIVLGLAAVLVFAFRGKIFNYGPDPWTEKQLMPPAALAQILNEPNGKKPIVLSIGFGGGIKGSKEIGAADDKEGIENLKKELNNFPKDANIVIYCGCCPFENCPNVRPAFELLNEMKFTNHSLLNLPQNLKADWIDKGYPMER